MGKSPIPPRALRTGAAASYVGCDRRTLLKLAKSGQVPYIRLTQRLLLFEVSDLDDLLSRNKIGG